MVMDIFSLWDYPLSNGLGYFWVTCMFVLGCFYYITVLGVFWYSPTNVDLCVKTVLSGLKNMTKESNVQHSSGISGLLMSLFFFTVMYVFGLFSPWCYPLGVHPVMITSISLMMWSMGTFYSCVVEDLSYVGHFCLPGDSLGLSGFMSSIEIISKFLQWITVSLRLSLNMIVGTFMIMGFFNYIGAMESILCSSFFKSASLLSLIKFICLGLSGAVAFMYELMIMFLQVFLYFFLWQVYLEDSASYYFLPPTMKKKGSSIPT